MSPIEKVLNSLESSRMVSLDKWIAKCPAHDDRRPSLSLKVATDGKVLIHCWAGCSTPDVLYAMGLDFSDLFPNQNRRIRGHACGSLTRQFDFRDAFLGVAHEILVVRLILEQMHDGQAVKEEHKERLALAETRVSDALAFVDGKND